ncbi:UNVERIFIED_CONTAM: hypothetical protein Sradi_5735100 [Sesamum radiatum]|uniref:Uncharacterized protein n=1 Tax=Sesamum radiatum TaxID=300843 RepID=A0AAW2L5T3_SESRA
MAGANNGRSRYARKPRGDTYASREAASPVRGDAAPGRGDQPRPGSPGRGAVPRPSRPSSLGRGGSPPPGAASVVPSRSSLSSVPMENVDFNDEVIEAIRNLPESHSDSLEFLAGSDSSQRMVVSPILIQSDDLESFVAPQSKLRCRAMDVENCDSSLGFEEFKLLSKKLILLRLLSFIFPR